MGKRHPQQRLGAGRVRLGGYLMAKYGPWFARDYAAGHKMSDLPGFTTYEDCPGSLDGTRQDGDANFDFNDYWRTNPFSGANGGIILDGVQATEAEVVFQMVVWTTLSRSDFAATKVQGSGGTFNQYRSGVRGGSRATEKYNNGSYSGIELGDPAATDQFDYFWVKVRTDDNVQEVTTWPATPTSDYSSFVDYEAPPYGPQLVTNDTSITGPGGVGVGFRGDTGMGIYWFSIGTDGDSAPIPGEVIEPTARRRPLIWVPY